MPWFKIAIAAIVFIFTMLMELWALDNVGIGGFLITVLIAFVCFFIVAMWWQLSDRKPGAR